MKNDIKTNSTDFLPQKPGASTPAPSNTDDGSAASTPADTSTAKPAGIPASMTAPSQHVIDLKNMDTSSSQPKDSKDYMVKNNPFLQGKDSSIDNKTTTTSAVPVAAEAVKDQSEMPAPPMPPAEKVEPPKAEPTTEADMPTLDTPPSVDLAHPEAAGEKDALKDAMVSDDATAKKPKKKLPTWLLVLIIVVAIILIGIATFAALTFLARPSGV